MQLTYKNCFTYKSVFCFSIKHKGWDEVITEYHLGEKDSKIPKLSGDERNRRLTNRLMQLKRKPNATAQLHCIVHNLLAVTERIKSQIYTLWKFLGSSLETM